MFIPLNIILTLRGNGDGWDPIKTFGSNPPVLGPKSKDPE